MQINKFTSSQSNQAVSNQPRSHTVGQGFTFLVGAVAALQGLRPASARALTQVPTTNHATLLLPPPAHAPASSPAHAPASSPARAPAPAAHAPLPIPGSAPRVSPPGVIPTPTSPRPMTPSPAPSPVPAGASPVSTQVGWNVNPNLSFSRKPVTSPLLASADLSAAANPLSPPVTTNHSLPYEAPHSYETCHARTPSGSTMCVQGIATASLGLLTSAPHTLTCNDTAHAFWTVENAAWGASLNSPLFWKNVVQFKNPNADQCCLTYESNWNICDDIYPAQNECNDVVNSCAMLTEDAQQNILRGAVPTATGETSNIPGTPGVCGINTNNQFVCLDKTNLFNIPPGRTQAPNVGTGYVPVNPGSGDGCSVSASSGALSSGCG